MTDIKALLEERGKIHGDFTEHAQITQALKLAASNGVNCKQGELTSVQMEAIEMILHKIGRIGSGDPNYKDHWLDIAGYAQLAADRCYTSSR